MKKRISNCLFWKLNILVVVLLIVLILSYIINIYSIAATNYKSIKTLNDKMIGQIHNEIQAYSELLNHIAESIIYYSSIEGDFSTVEKDFYKENLTRAYLNTVFEEMMKDKEITAHSEMYLLDAEGAVVAAYNAGSSDNFSVEAIKKQGSYYVEEQETVIDGWKIVSVIPNQEMIFGSPGLYVNVTITYLLVAVMLITLLYLFGRWVIRPLGEMDTFIKNSLSDPDARMTTDRTDEIGTVINRLNWMLDEKEILQYRVQQSQRKMYEAELAKRKLQILAYRNQINPHFLYNTFDCIKAMAVYYDADEIVELTISLSNVFRYAVKGENRVLVEDEINNIKEYAKIIGFRFAGKIRIHVQVDETVRRKQMIKLLLQPLVENAVFHGVEKNLNGGDVFVTVQPMGGSGIRFCVEDNGCGMTEERKKEVLAMLGSGEKEDSHKEKKGGIGLSNIYGRLKLFYGDDVQFTIESSLESGTKVIIVVPDEIEEEERENV